jgi:glycosyltransferase involved in cell wall biosynthesis
MKIICLTFSHHFAHAEDFIKKKYPGQDYLILEIRRTILNPLELFRYVFAKAEVKFVLIMDIESGLGLDIAGTLAFISRAGERFILDLNNTSKTVSLREGLQYLGRVILDAVSFPLVFPLVFLRSHALRKPVKGRFDCSRKSVFYLRTDAGGELRAGGSVAHTVGVLKGFLHWEYRPEYYGALTIRGVEDLGIPVNYLRKTRWLRNLPELPFISFSEVQYAYLRDICSSRRPGMIYQRYSLENYTGALLAKKNGLPFVLEYNGSDVWVARNWGTPLIFEKLAEKIELANLKAADLIVVVSQPLRDDLTERGIDPGKILLNPNGVDAERYRPDIDGSGIKDALGLKDKVVAGFIGTFGKWHGAEVFAAAIKDVVKENGNLHFLFIGDGMTMPLVKEIISRDEMGKHVTFTGLIPQEDAPQYLAACDMLISPHVPNPDGTPFFGSPTKLFEYMAMGKAIVASDLDQIGEVLENEKTALMVKPRDAGALAAAIVRLARDEKVRSRLGSNARAEALVKYTWTQHVARILFALKEMR